MTFDLPTPSVVRSFAALAIEVAKDAPEATKVGAVIVKGEKLIATGYRGEYAGLHAEQVVLEKARALGVKPSGCTLFSTLEPCANSRTGRVPCAELIAASGIKTVVIGDYDRNPQVYRLGWKRLVDAGIKVMDFPPDLRAEVSDVNKGFSSNFIIGYNDKASGAKFDFTQNGGFFTIARDPDPQSPSWETRWTNCGADAIYAYGGAEGIVAHARFATSFEQIDDPDALDYGGHSARIPLGGIAVFRNSKGWALCKVKKIEPTADYGGGDHVSVSISWELRERI